MTRFEDPIDLAISKASSGVFATPPFGVETYYEKSIIPRNIDSSIHQ
jgi:hypothetical protein